MTSPRFEPRSFCAVPEHFGRFPTDWKKVVQTNEQAKDQLGAARVQHQVSWRIRRAITASSHKTIENYAKAIGADPSRMGRMLRGTIVMRVEDMISAERHLGISIWAPSLTAADESAPSNQDELDSVPGSRKD